MIFLRGLLFIIFLTGCNPIEIPYLDGRWRHTPDIEICNDLYQSDEWIIEQLDWWGEEVSPAYKYGEVFNSSCEKDAKKGVIRFGYADPDEGKWTGITYTKKYERFSFKNNDDVARGIVSARIYLKPNKRVWTARHEIGHAYGWDHFPPEYENVMDQAGGRGVKGLRAYPEPKD